MAANRRYYAIRLTVPQPYIHKEEGMEPGENDIKSEGK